MARVFLSYDREDASKARLVAVALEKAGHGVWWDLHIKGGAEYGKVIEQALAKADAVVVLWSPRSVDSAWVRDEAAAGRDSGRLIPVLLEPVNPPMGFRQYQSVDLSAWKGRGKPARLAEVLAAIDGIAGAGPSTPSPATIATAVPPKRAATFSRWLPIAVLVMLVLIGTAWLIKDRSAPRVHTVAVTAATSSSDSQNLARELLAKLGNLQTTKTESLKLVSGDEQGEDSDFVFKVNAQVAAGDSTSASLLLFSDKDNALLWSKDFQQVKAKEGDLKQQLAFTAAKVLECAVEALTTEGGRVRQKTLKLYLNGCSAHSELAAADPRPLIPIFRAVVSQAPRFQGAWAKLIHAEAEVAISGDWESDSKRIRPQLLRDMAEAKKLNPTMAEVLLAEADLAPPSAYAKRMELLETAVERNPESSEALAAYSNGLAHVGRGYDAVDRAKRAAQLDPLSPFTRDNLITALTYAGQLDVALEELRKAEQLWPGASNLLAARYRIHLRYGDPHEALRIQRLGDYGGPHRDAFLQARIDPTPASIEKAISYPRRWMQVTPRAIGELAQVLGAFGKEEDLFRILLDWRHPDHVDSVIEVLFRPALKDFRRNPRMMAVAKQIGLLDYWRTSGAWPDFCREPGLPYDCKSVAAKLN